MSILICICLVKKVSAGLLPGSQVRHRKMSPALIAEQGRLMSVTMVAAVLFQKFQIRFQFMVMTTDFETKIKV